MKISDIIGKSNSKTLPAYEWPRYLIGAYIDNYMLYAALFVSYLVVTLFSFYTYHIAGIQPAVILAPQGVALAIALLYGYASIPITALSSFFVSLYGGNSLLVALLAFFSNLIQLALTLYIVDSLDISRTLENVWDFYRYIAVAFFTCAIVPIVNVLGRKTLAAPSTPLVWSNLWIAGLVSVLILTPFLVRLIRPSRRFTTREWFENLTAIIALNIITAILTYTPTTTALGVNLIIPFCLILVFIALRGGTFFVSFAMFMVSVSAISGRILGHPANPQLMDIPSQIVNAETSLIFFALLFYFIAAVEEGRRTTYENLQALYRDTAAADQAKSNFIAVLAHELRNPLAPVLSSIEYLKLQPMNKEAGDAIDTMSSSISMMRRLLDDLLDTARLTKGKLELRLSNVRVGDLVAQSVASVRDLAASRNITLRVRSEADDVVLYADPVRLKQACMNLLNNACKYTELGGVVELTALVNSGFLIIEIKDTGVGINPEVRSTLFEPFKSGHASRGGIGTGLGIGLFLTKRLVEMHEGAIEAESRGADFGSTFRIRIPLSTPTNTSELPQKMPKVTSSRILVVDDNESAVYGLKRLLEHYGHQVDIALSGSEALGIVPHYKPDIILLDIGLPDMSGYDVARTLRAEGNRCAIVALTGYGQDSDRNQSQKAGFDRHLIKPAGIAEIIEVVNELLVDKTEFLHKYEQASYDLNNRPKSEARLY